MSPSSVTTASCVECVEAWCDTCRMRPPRVPRRGAEPPRPRRGSRPLPGTVCTCAGARKRRVDRAGTPLDGEARVPFPLGLLRGLFVARFSIDRIDSNIFLCFLLSWGLSAGSYVAHNVSDGWMDMSAMHLGGCSERADAEGGHRMRLAAVAIRTGTLVIV